MVEPPSVVTVRTDSPEATEALGRVLGARLLSGDVVALCGPLGSGKTVMAKGIALGAGASGHMASPSFVVIREYPGPITVFHADLYRIEKPSEIDHLGLEELAGGDGILLVEWADRFPGFLPTDHLEVRCAFGESPQERRITLAAPPSMEDRLPPGLGVTA